MIPEKRTNFSSEEKVRILRRQLVDKIPMSDPCDGYALHATVFYRWQKMFIENGTRASEWRDHGRTPIAGKRKGGVEDTNAETSVLLTVSLLRQNA
ncbi:transposase [bacterium]|nr:transposase [bacterium]